MSFRKIMSVSIAAVLMSTVSAYCDDNDIKVIIDGTAVGFDVPPQIINGRTLVPVRAIFEALGAEVEWNGEQQTVTASNGGTVVKMTIGVNTIDVNSETVVLDVPPQIINNRTLVPARAVAESFSADVSWDGEKRVVNIVTVTPTQTAVPEMPTQTDALKAQEFGIEYDYTQELNTSYMRDFKIEKLEKTPDGKYNMTYSVKTFLEGRGVVSVSFRCLDKNGKTVDSWTKGFIGTDYTWSPHEETITISGDTAKIELVYTPE